MFYWKCVYVVVGPIIVGECSRDLKFEMNVGKDNKYCA